MFVRIVNLFLLIFSVQLCIIQGWNSSINDLDYRKFRRYLNNKIEQNAPLKKLIRKIDQSVDENFDTNSQEFFLGKMKCSRYNIEKKTAKVLEEGNNRFMDFVWTFTNEENATVTVSIPINNKSTFLSRTTIPAEIKDEIYFVVHCNIPNDKENLTEEMKFINDTNLNFKNFTNISGQLHKFYEILVEEENLTKSIEKKFYVKNSVDNLNIIILGNLSKLDLQIPVHQERLLQWNENGKISDLMSSLKRMTQTKGLQLNVRNPPLGEWCLKLKPGESSNYRFIATIFNDSKTEEKNYFKNNENSTNEFKEEEEEIVAESRYVEEIVEKPITYNTDDKMRTDNESSIKFSSRSIDINDNDEETRHFKTSDEEKEKWMNISNILKQQKFIYIDSKDDSLRDLTQSTNLDSRIVFPETQFTNEETKNNNNNKFKKILVVPQIEDRINHESLELEDLTRDASDSFFQKKVVTVDVNSDTNLIIRPGERIFRIIFDVRNNLITETVLCYGAISPRFKTRLYISNPPLPNAYCHVVSPGQLISVTVEILSPQGISGNVHSVTLSVLVQGSQPKTIQKTANFYIQNSNLRKVDDTRPVIKYYFNNNCGGHLREDKCSKSIWSVDITVQDVDSGLKQVTSSPYGLEARTDYVSGTTNQVTFFYYATCCHQAVDISAVDMYGNYNNRRIDVTEWDNLSDGEIIAIVMGVLFLILLLILIVLLIMYCVKRRKSRDLPFTQRYGSGSPEQRPERTRF